MWLAGSLALAFTEATEEEGATLGSIWNVKGGSVFGKNGGSKEGEMEENTAG